MNSKLLIIIGFSILYGFSELLSGIRQREKKNISKSGDKGSMWIIVISISIGYWLSFIIGSTSTGRINHWNALFVSGAILIITGLIIRINSIMTLKKQFTYTITKINNHKLIENGLYKYIRHPGYLGQLLIFTGVATSLSNWLSIILMIIPVFLGYIYRIKVEEKFMIRQLGDEYIDYQKRTKKLIPALY